jgi:hypothetical protein
MFSSLTLPAPTLSDAAERDDEQSQSSTSSPVTRESLRASPAAERQEALELQEEANERHLAEGLDGLAVDGTDATVTAVENEVASAPRKDGTVMSRSSKDSSHKREPSVVAPTPRKSATQEAKQALGESSQWSLAITLVREVYSKRL